MINECNSDLSHAELVSYTAQHLRARWQKVRTEFVLKDGRRADVIAVDRDGTVAIFECKTTFRGWEAQMTAARYLKWCHLLFVVVNVGDWKPERRAALDIAQKPAGVALGVIECDRLAIRTLRTTVVRPMDEATYTGLIERIDGSPEGAHWLRGRLTAMRR